MSNYKGIERIRPDVLTEFEEAGRLFGRPAFYAPSNIYIGPGAKHDITMGPDGQPQVVCNKDPRRNLRKY